MSMEVMEPPCKEVLDKVRSEFGLNEQRSERSYRTAEGLDTTAASSA
jgi:hypothetical protein